MNTADRVKEIQNQLEEALISQDLAEIRKQVAALFEAVSGVVETLGALPHLLRLADIGLETAAMLHELRQPLAGIKAMGEFIAAATDSSQLVKERAAAIVQYAKVMEIFCERVRTYARAEPVQIGHGQVAQAVDAALEMLRQTLRGASLRIDVSIEDNLPDVAIDELALQQVLVNLLRNARDALGGEGIIRILGRRHRDTVEILVSDNGPGIPKEVRERLFAPFFSTKPDGVGLGLWLSKRIIEQAHGSLMLVDCSEGTTFLIQLPLLRES